MMMAVLWHVFLYVAIGRMYDFLAGIVAYNGELWRFFPKHFHGKVPVQPVCLRVRATRRHGFSVANNCLLNQCFNKQVRCGCQNVTDGGPWH